MRKKFLRRDNKRYLKLGKVRRKKQKWRRPKGRDNKMREGRAGYSRTVSIGYGGTKEKLTVRVSNIKELDSIKEKKIVLAAGIGRKKKLEMINKCKEKGIEIENMNIKKFMKKIEEEKAKKKEEKVDSKGKAKEESKKKEAKTDEMKQEEKSQKS